MIMIYAQGVTVTSVGLFKKSKRESLFFFYFFDLFGFFMKNFEFLKA